MIPQVSVITPAHNVAPWIEAAIRSVVAQTLGAIEYVVVEDSSTDATYDVASSVADSRLVVLKISASSCAAARNAGVRASSAPYVAFLDGDDLWMPEKLERQVAVLNEHPEIDLTFSWSRIIEESGFSTSHLQRAAPGVTGFEDVLTRNVVGNGSSVVMRRSALERAGPFDETLRAASDFDMWLRVAALRPDNCWCLPEPLTLYRRRSGQVTNNWRLSQAGTERVMEKVRALPLCRSASMQSKAEATNHQFYAFAAYESNECRMALQLLARALRFSPAFVLGNPATWSLAAAICVKAVLPSWAFEPVRVLARRIL